MKLLDQVGNHLPSGGAEDSARRQDLLAVLLRAFGHGGGGAVTAEVTRRLDEQEQEFDRRLQALQHKL